MQIVKPEPTVAYLSPSFYPYRVPLFDGLSSKVGDGFSVVTNKHQLQPNAIAAQKMGSFSRVLLRGRHVQISQHHDSGLETPLGITVAPSLGICLARLRPDVVISLNFSPWTLTSLVMGFPTIIFWEGTPHTERTVKPYRLWLRSWMARRAKGFVVNGALSRQYLVERLTVPDQKIVEGGLCAGPPPEDVSVKQPRKVGYGQTVRFLYSGRLVDGKGVRHLIDAAAHLKHRLPPGTTFEVAMLGDGPEHAYLSEAIRRRGLTEEVQLVGAVPPEQVWRHYADAHVLVHPTLQDNWPLVVPEAMAMGLPILLSKYAGSVPDLLREGHNGYVFDPADHGQLASLMAKYVEDPRLVQQQGSKSMMLVSSYTPEIAVDAHLRAIEAALR